MNSMLPALHPSTMCDCTAIYLLTDRYCHITYVKRNWHDYQKKSKIEEKNEIAKNRIGCWFDYDGEREWKRIRPAV